MCCDKINYEHDVTNFRVGGKGMNTQLQVNEEILFEKAANWVGAALSKGGAIMLTNQRLLFESSLMGANAKLELDIPLHEITGYRKAYTMALSTGILAAPNAVSIITKTDTYKFTIYDRDTLFSHFSEVIPQAEQLPNEKYVEGVKDMGSKVFSKFMSKNNNVSSQQQYSAPTQTGTMIPCPSCDAENLKTAKFCNICGAKMQLECPNCHAPLEDGKKFCGECGTPFKRKDECIKCGTKIRKGQKFCNECGERVGE